MPYHCAFGCKHTGEFMHVFPNPDKYPERFKVWVDLLGTRLGTSSNSEVYRKKRICDIHFTERHRNRFKRLNALAVPTLYLPDSDQHMDMCEQDETETISSKTDITKQHNIVNNMSDEPLQSKIVNISSNIDERVQDEIVTVPSSNKTDLPKQDKVLILNSHKNELTGDVRLIPVNFPVEFPDNQTSFETVYFEDTLPVVENTVSIGAKCKTTDKTNNKEQCCNPEKKIKLEMCRICYKHKAQYPIFNNNQHPNIPEDILFFSGIHIQETDSFPESICDVCLDLLVGCIYFRKMCRRTNGKLIRLFKKNENNEMSIETLVVEKKERSPSPVVSEDDADNVWRCNNCNETFYDEFAYTVHFSDCDKKQSEISKSEKEKQVFLCDTCGKIARSKASLLVHMAIHENVFPHKCDQCPYQGRTGDLLKVHKRTHLSDKPYKCTLCPKSTSTASNLGKHMRQIHSTSRPYKCSYCERGFSFQHYLNRHIKDTHLRQGTVQCEICSKFFNTRKILQGHRFKVHKIKGERHGRLPSYLQCQQQLNNDDIEKDDYKMAKIDRTIQ